MSIRTKDLRSLKVDQLRDDAYGYCGVFKRDPAGGYLRQLGVTWPDRRSVERSVSRRKVTVEFLSLAALHNRTTAEERIAAVCDAFNVSERTAFRYIAQAEKAGLLDDHP
jgi:hypothetical protein